MLTKTTFVLHRDPLFKSTFSQRFKEGEEFRTHEMTLDPHVFQDMGRPERITVTIEPGDQLNKASDHPVGEEGTP